MARRTGLLTAAALVLLFCFIAPVRAADCGAAAAPGVDWSGCDFSGAPKLLTGASLAGANLTGANLSGSSFIFMDMSTVTAVGTDFSGASFSNVNFSGAYVGGADFDGAVLAFVDFTGAGGVPINVDQASAFTGVTCPGGDAAPENGDCGWVPTAVHLGSFTATAAGTPAAALLAAVLLLVTAVSGLLVCGFALR